MVAGFDIGRGGKETYYSRGISSTLPVDPVTHQPRRPSRVEHAVNMRLYRTAWLVVLVPLLIAAFTIMRPAPLPRPPSVLEPTFDVAEAARLANELDSLYPDRSPGTPGAAGAASWVRKRFQSLGLDTSVDTFTGAIPGRTRTDLNNVSAVVPGRSLDSIVVVAHRDSTAGRSGLDDNASGTGALIELARAVGAARTNSAEETGPNHTLRFVSTDAGAYGMLGARRLARSTAGDRTLAVIALDAVGSKGAPRVEIVGRGPRSPDPSLLSTITARLSEEDGLPPRTTGAVGQLIDLAFPYGQTEQLELLAAGVPAVAVSADGDLPGSGPQKHLETSRLRQIGRAVESTIASLDAGLAPTVSSRPYVQTRGRLIRGWAIALVYVAALIPFAVTLLDLLTRLRRRAVAFLPALRSYLRRLAFWLWAGGIFLLFGLAGAWPEGDPAAISPDSKAAGNWPRLGLVLYVFVIAVSWLVARARLVKRQPVTDEEAVAGMAAALTALAAICLVTIVTNIYALLLLLPSAHAWLVAVAWRMRRGWLRGLVYAVGLLGPLLVLGSLAVRFGIGLDAPWYLAELTAIGYVPMVALVLSLAWVAVSAQILAAISGRYAPYPAPPDRPVRGPVGTVVFSLRHHRGEPHEVLNPGSPQERA
jgi:hypothetical protein